MAEARPPAGRPTRRALLRAGAAVPLAGAALAEAGLAGVGLAGVGLGEAAGAAAVTADVCVYGATMAGVAAAVQVARMGGSAVVVEPTSHVGGMTTGGLSRTDVGVAGTIGGLAREFYRRVNAAYVGAPVSVTMPMRPTFEPHVAAKVVADLLSASGVAVYTGRTLASVGRAGARLSSLTASDGTTVTARMFVDASYEGDLLALAGVRFTVGREPNSRYAEDHNGVQPSTKNQFTVAVDPYRTPGDPASGLLPEISAATLAATGSGDAHVQAYSYRLCLTRASNRIPFPKPSVYSSARYALVTRLIAAGYADPFADKAAAFLTKAALPGGKADANSGGPFSLDHVGASDAYPTATWSRRATIVADHVAYTQGLLYFLANDPRVRSDVRSAIAAFGLAPDEFTATGGWPPALYVREARRMVSPYYVVTEDDCRGRTTVSDGVALASYQRDSHNCQRLVAGGVVTNEGDVQLPVPAPFRVPYRAMVPAATECANLLVPVCLSASHVAFGSLRTEPVFAMLGQAAGAAAKIAIDAGVGVAAVDVGALRARLFEEMAVLDYPDVAVDNDDASAVVTGAWTASTATLGYYGSDYLEDGNSGKGGKSVRFAPSLPADGTYRVYLRWTSGASRASNVAVAVAHRVGTATVAVDQRTGGGRWAALGDWPFAAGSAGTVTVTTGGTNGYVVADAVRFVRVA